MEGALRRSGFGGEVQEKKRLHSYDDQDIEEVGYGRQVHEDNNLKPNSPNQKDLGIINKQVPNVTATKGPSMDPNPKACSSQMDQGDELESAKAEWSAATEENERLKTIIARIVKDHQSLQLHLLDIVGKEEAKESKHTSPAHEEVERSELISLSLGRSSSDPKKEENNSNSRKSNEDEELKEGLSLGLDCKFEVSKMDQMKPISNPSAKNSFDVPKNEELGEQWPPSKILKTIRSGDDEEVSQQTHVKRARVSVRARCDTPTMNDGCHWRKYGQKIAKGNPCPRAYYRCTLAPACPVRKQVQRCYDDTSILNTTYEGTHNHPLPISATAMASTTSAAARMLLSGSSSSQPTIGASITTTTAANLHGVNFSLPDNLRSSQFYLPNSSISSLPSHPTITLDLTAPSSFSSSSSASQFSQLSSSNFSMMTPRYPSTNFNFSYSGSNSLPISWGNGYLSYGTQPDNKIQMGSLNLGRQTQEHIHQSYMEKNNITPPQQSLTDTIAAATKALTSDPSFRSVLATAIASIVGGGTVGPQGKKSGGLK